MVGWQGKDVPGFLARALLCGRRIRPSVSLSLHACPGQPKAGFVQGKKIDLPGSARAPAAGQPVQTSDPLPPAPLCCLNCWCPSPPGPLIANHSIYPQLPSAHLTSPCQRLFIGEERLKLNRAGLAGASSSDYSRNAGRIRVLFCSPTPPTPLHNWVAESRAHSLSESWHLFGHANVLYLQGVGDGSGGPCCGTLGKVAAYNARNPHGLWFRTQVLYF